MLPFLDVSYETSERCGGAVAATRTLQALLFWMKLRSMSMVEGQPLIAKNIPAGCVSTAASVTKSAPQKLQWTW